MNEAGISIDEACANNVIGTKEDFERNCNPDGTVKEHSGTTTISVKNLDKSATIDNSYLQIGLVLAILVILLIAGIIIKQIRQKPSK